MPFNPGLGIRPQSAVLNACSFINFFLPRKDRSDQNFLNVINVSETYYIFLMISKASFYFQQFGLMQTLWSDADCFDKWTHAIPPIIHIHQTKPSNSFTKPNHPTPDRSIHQFRTCILCPQALRVMGSSWILLSKKWSNLFSWTTWRLTWLKSCCYNKVLLPVPWVTGLKRNRDPFTNSVAQFFKLLCSLNICKCFLK